MLGAAVALIRAVFASEILFSTGYHSPPSPLPSKDSPWLKVHNTRVIENLLQLLKVAVWLLKGLTQKLYSTIRQLVKSQVQMDQALVVLKSSGEMLTANRSEIAAPKPTGKHGVRKGGVSLY